MLTYLLLAVKNSQAEDILKQVQEIDKNITEKVHKKISKISMVYGEFDILVRLKSKNELEAKELINRIKAIKGVGYIKTYVVLDRTKETDNPFINKEVKFRQQSETDFSSHL